MTRSALILIDLQEDYFPDGRFPLEGIEAAAGNAAQALATARSHGLQVIHIRHEFPDADAPFFVKGSEGARIHATIAPETQERILTKAHPNAFRDTPLAEIIETAGITAVTLVGAMTHICIDATARAAADRGLAVSVLHDATATREVSFGDRSVAAADVQAAFLGALAFGIAEVKDTRAFIETLEPAPSAA